MTASLSLPVAPCDHDLVLALIATPCEREVRVEFGRSERVHYDGSCGCCVIDVADIAAQIAEHGARCVWCGAEVGGDTMLTETGGTER